LIASFAPNCWISRKAFAFPNGRRCVCITDFILLSTGTKWLPVLENKTTRGASRPFAQHFSYYTNAELGYIGTLQKKAL
jgi:hypothetical protein